MEQVCTIERIVNIESIVSAFEAKRDENFEFKGEFHPFWEFVYVIDGSTGVAGNDSIYKLKKGDIIFHKPMEFHRLWATDGEKSHVFIMSFYANGSVLKKFENSIYNLSEKPKEKLQGLIDYFRENTFDEEENYNYFSFLENRRKSPEFSQLAANMLECFLLSLISETSLNDAREQSKGEIILYKKIINILTQNVCNQITVEEIARECHVSISKLKAVFSKYSDMGIHKFFLKLKTEEAIKLIREDYTLSEVCERLSVSNPNYLSYIIKRETGFPPNYHKRK